MTVNINRGANVRMSCVPAQEQVTFRLQCESEFVSSYVREGPEL